MEYKNQKIREVREHLLSDAYLSGLQNRSDVLKAVELKSLYKEIGLLPEQERADFGKEVNSLKTELETYAEAQDFDKQLPPIDLTAPFDVNTPSDKHPKLLGTELGSMHPLMTELSLMLEIFYRMGFSALESRQIDDDYHMFAALNFPPEHPARDDYDTFMTAEGLIAPAHTSTMQNRILRKYKNNLTVGKPIAAVIPGRVFRNEDLDARHEHTFYQLEGVYVDSGIHAGHLLTTLQTFLESYYGQSLEIKSQPFYFPFTEPSFELAMSCPFCQKKGCAICSQTGWIELLGCGMIHPNVLKAAEIDPQLYSGFAWGMGIDRLVMRKYDIEDVRHFESGKLEFLRQFR
jgi:phenylalanyl-tRNA synthetase alpha chain